MLPRWDNFQSGFGRATLTRVARQEQRVDFIVAARKVDARG